MPIHLGGEGLYSRPVQIHPESQMIEQSGPTTIGNNQVTLVLAAASNPRGFILNSFYTQVIQAGSPGNVAHSLVVVAATAPIDFSTKQNCFPLFRTYQNDKASPIALDGYAPMNICDIRFPANWGIWQICTVTGATLDRNNMRFGLTLL